LPWALPTGDPMVGNIALIVAILSGLLFAVPAYRLYQTLDMKHARTLMFASFAYLPIVQLAFVLDKI
jgi:protoheme IX farnesyltransferase